MDDGMTINNWALKELIGNLRVKADPFGIYKQRRMLAHAMPGVAIYRGDEWWTAAADKEIQSNMDADQIRTLKRVGDEFVEAA